jgi:hypothetical protein
MTKAAVLGALAGALTLGLVASSAAAAPVGSGALRIEPASTVERVDHRRYDRDRRYHRDRDRVRDYRHRRDYAHRHYRRDHHRHVGVFPFLLLPFLVFALAH